VSRIVARPLTENEPDLLPGLEMCNLVFKNEDGITVRDIPAPALGWTHDSLEAQERLLPAGITQNVWDAYLIGQEPNWIGSSEI
jgi:hypothetical protein